MLNLRALIINEVAIKIMLIFTVQYIRIAFNIIKFIFNALRFLRALKILTTTLFYVRRKEISQCVNLKGWFFFNDRNSKFVLKAMTKRI
jgi:hypothetical protein